LQFQISDRRRTADVIGLHGEKLLLLLLLLLVCLC